MVRRRFSTRRGDNRLCKNSTGLTLHSVGVVLDHIPARRTRRIHLDRPRIFQTFSGTNERRSW